MSVSIENLSTMKELYSRSWLAEFKSPLAERWFLLRVTQCSFPEQGRYQIRLLADDQLIGQSTLEVL